MIVKIFDRDVETWPDFASAPVEVENSDGSTHFEILATSEQYEKRKKDGLVTRTFSTAPAKNKRIENGKEIPRHMFGNSLRCPIVENERIKNDRSSEENNNSRLVD